MWIITGTLTVLFTFFVLNTLYKMKLCRIIFTKWLCRILHSTDWIEYFLQNDWIEYSLHFLCWILFTKKNFYRIIFTKWLCRILNKGCVNPLRPRAAYLRRRYVSSLLRKNVLLPFGTKPFLKPMLIFDLIPKNQKNNISEIFFLNFHIFIVKNRFEISVLNFQSIFSRHQWVK